MKRVLFIFVMISSLTLTALSVEAEISGNDKAQRLFADIMSAQEYPLMHNAYEKTLSMPKEQLEEILALCIKNISDYNTLHIEGRTIPSKHDITTIGGRSAWLASNILNVELPEINAKASTDDIAAARRLIILAVRENRDYYEKEHAKEINELSLTEKIIHAKSKSTKAFVLSLLSEDENIDVRKAVASNPSSTPSILVRLAQDDSDIDVRKLALENLERTRMVPPND